MLLKYFFLTHTIAALLKIYVAQNDCLPIICKTKLLNCFIYVKKKKRETFKIY